MQLHILSGPPVIKNKGREGFNAKGNIGIDGKERRRLDRVARTRFFYRWFYQKKDVLSK